MSIQPNARDANQLMKSLDPEIDILAASYTPPGSKFIDRIMALGSKTFGIITSTLQRKQSVAIANENIPQTVCERLERLLTVCESAKKVWNKKSADIDIQLDREQQEALKDPLPEVNHIFSLPTDELEANSERIEMLHELLQRNLTGAEQMVKSLEVPNQQGLKEQINQLKGKISKIDADLVDGLESLKTKMTATKEAIKVYKAKEISVNAQSARKKHEFFDNKVEVPDISAIAACHTSKGIMSRLAAGISRKIFGIKEGHPPQELTNENIPQILKEKIEIFCEDVSLCCDAWDQKTNEINGHLEQASNPLLDFGTQQAHIMRAKYLFDSSIEEDFVALRHAVEEVQRELTTVSNEILPAEEKAPLEGDLQKLSTPLSQMQQTHDTIKTELTDREVILKMPREKLFGIDVIQPKINDLKACYVEGQDESQIQHLAKETVARAQRLKLFPSLTLTNDEKIKDYLQQSAAQFMNDTQLCANAIQESLTNIEQLLQGDEKAQHKGNRKLANLQVDFERWKELAHEITTDYETGGNHANLLQYDIEKLRAFENGIPALFNKFTE